MKCSFEMLIRYLEKRLKLDEQLEVLDHLDHCEACFETLYLLSRDRDAAYHVYRPLKEIAS